MAKSYGSRKKSSFSQKKKNMKENEELRESGMLDMLSNRQRLFAEYEDAKRETSIFVIFRRLKKFLRNHMYGVLNKLKSTWYLKRINLTQRHTRRQ